MCYSKARVTACFAYRERRYAYAGKTVQYFHERKNTAPSHLGSDAGRQSIWLQYLHSCRTGTL